jgi:hypothetical protein
MGPDPSTAVVDATLRVHGVAGLRIVDASIMPQLVRGNTNAPTIMIAEKGSRHDQECIAGSLGAPRTTDGCCALGGLVSSMRAVISLHSAEYICPSTLFGA